MLVPLLLNVCSDFAHRVRKAGTDHGASKGSQNSKEASFFLSHGVHSVKNGRDGQEDRYLVQDLRVFPEFKPYHRAALYAVFDGHGGNIVSDYLSRHLAQHFTSQPDLKQLLQHSPLKALTYALQACEHDVLARHYDAGSTAVVVLLLDDMLYHCNVGDSRAILVSRGTLNVRQLSTDHKAEEPSERARLQAAGAFIDSEGYLEGQVLMSRNVGSAHIKLEPANAGKLICEPATGSVPLGPDDVAVILACDGVTDVYDNWKAGSKVRAALARGRSAEQAAHKLVGDAAAHPRNYDNVTAIVVQLQERV